MKRFKIGFLMILFSIFAYGADYSLSTHILDLGTGYPAEKVKVELYAQQKDQWKKVSEALTSSDGRVNDFPLSSGKLKRGIYKLRFYTKEYFTNRNLSTFYPYIEVIFEFDSPHHYHVPITLSAYGYATYRGS